MQLFPEIVKSASRASQHCDNSPIRLRATPSCEGTTEGIVAKPRKKKNHMMQRDPGGLFSAHVHCKISCGQMVEPFLEALQ